MGTSAPVRRIIEIPKPQEVPAPTPQEAPQRQPVKVGA